MPLRNLLTRKVMREAVDEAVYQRVLQDCVAEVVRQQVQVGIDIPSDGEFGKSGWTNYVAARLSGLEPMPANTQDGAPLNPRTAGREGDRFLDYYNAYHPVQTYDWTTPDSFGDPTTTLPPDSGAFQCTGPISYQDAQIRR